MQSGLAAGNAFGCPGGVRTGQCRPCLAGHPCRPSVSSFISMKFSHMISRRDAQLLARAWLRPMTLGLRRHPRQPPSGHRCRPSQDSALSRSQDSVQQWRATALQFKRLRSGRSPSMRVSDVGQCLTTLGKQAAQSQRDRVTCSLWRKDVDAENTAF